jgi:very-short-patch-repair endonuclease
LRTADIRTATRARSLRQADNEAEAALWSDLRARRLNGYKFVRQLPFNRYFADFACRDQMLVVEVDGSQHADSEYDRERDAAMAELGWSVLRVWNVDVLKERNSVLETIVAALEGRLEPVAARDLRFVRGRRFGSGES